MSERTDGFATDDALRDAVRANPLWYHTIDLRDGITSPGWFDLRSIVERLPWPDVVGKRCLDIGTYDGFLAFELERRGAAEVVATDISEHASWDWPIRVKESGPERLAELAGPKGSGFEIAVRAKRSRVTKREISVYDLHPDAVGRFDVVVCGSLLLHLRDPVRALHSIRSVCDGYLMSSEEIDPWLTVVHPRGPVTRFNGVSLMQWHVPNAEGHRRLVVAGGFDIEKTVRPYAIRFGPSHPPLGRSIRSRARQMLVRMLCGATGVPHSAVLARPA